MSKTKKILSGGKKPTDKDQGKEVQKKASTTRGPGRPPADHSRIRFTTIIEPQLRTKIKIIAARDNRPIHDVFNEAVKQYVDRYEADNGKI